MKYTRYTLSSQWEFEEAMLDREAANGDQLGVEGVVQQAESEWTELCWASSGSRADLLGEPRLYCKVGRDKEKTQCDLQKTLQL
jgi:hypothetical protein